MRKALAFLVLLFCGWASAQPTVTVTYPTGGETFYAGTVVNVTWTQDLDVTGDTLYYSTDNGGSWNFVWGGSADITYPWSVPNQPTAVARVLVIAVNPGGEGNGVSNSFIIRGPPTVSITYPSGGQTLYVGTVANVTWTADSGVTGDTLYYSTNNGGSWNFVWGGPEDTTYPWTVPNQPTAQAKVKVIAVNPAGSGSGVSDTFFIKGTPVVAVTHPSGGETLYVGTIANVTWTQDSSVTGDTLYYSTDNGGSWSFLWGGPEDTTYPWTVPNQPTAQAKVKVIAVNLAGPSSGASNAFLIKGPPSVTVTSPNGGEHWPALTVHDITWTQDIDVTGDTVYYSTDDGASWNFIWGGPDTTGHPWTVPNQPTLLARVKVIAVNPAGAGEDSSDAVFEIQTPGPTVTVTYPSGGETLYAFAVANVTWTQDSSVTGDTLYYSIDNGLNWNWVWGGPKDTTSPWTVPDWPTSEARVKVIAVNPTGPDSSTSNAFNIMGPPVVTVTYPSGGETLYSGTVANVAWTQDSNVTGDTLYYSTDDGGSWSFIWGGPDTTGHPWTVPDQPTLLAKVKVIAVNPAGLGDSVSNAFTIKGPPTVTVTSPNGGEHWQALSVHDVTWTQDSNVTGDTLYYSTDDGASWVFQWGGPAAEPYPWTVPDDPTVQAKVKVIAVNPAGPSQDQSDTVFEIQTPAPVVTVISPNGGEAWQVGALHNIVWTSSNSTTDSICYSTDNGGSWQFVAKQSPPTDTYPWTVPNTPSVNCLVKVTAIGSSMVEGQSATVFAIFSIAIFREDFNEAWSTTSPPPGWQIKYAGDSGIAAWHREPGRANPWPTNVTGYAAIVYDGHGTSQTDSLISPTIDCGIYRDVALRCSTFFVPAYVQPWTAKLMVSSDNGSTWATLYNYAESLGPRIQTFDMSAYANLNSQVRVMWVWSGDLVNLFWWALDNVEVDGIATFANDISVGPIVRPRKSELPSVPFPPEAYFNNVGRHPETGVRVRCEIDDHTGGFVYGDSQTVDIGLDSSQLVQFAPVGLAADTGYRAHFTVQTPDNNPLNDTLGKRFDAEDQMLIAYDDGIVAGDSYYTSANQGWGLMVVPETTPAQILDARFNLHLPVSGDTYLYKVRIVDADGSGGAPGTTLYESGPLVAQEGWNTDTLESLRLYAWRDTFYLFYVQDGDWPDAAELNHDIARTDSVQYWKLSSAGYRPDSLHGDWMIRCSLDLAPAPVPAGVNARTVYVSQPDDEIVLRPAGVGFVPEARVENFGGTPIAPLPCACTVYTQSGTPVYSSTATLSTVLPHQGAYVSFDTWMPNFFDSARVVVRTMASGDVDPTDDAKSKIVFIHESHTTGFEPLDRYAWIDCDTAGGPTYSWVDTTSAYVLITANIDERVRIPINQEFTFPYRDTTYGQFYVCNNGWLSLGSDPLTQTGANLPLPDTSAPKSALFPYWDSMYAGATAHSKVFWKIINVGGAQRLVVIWQDMRFPGADTTNLVSFEAILEEGTGFIWFQYKHTNGGLASHNYGRTATVGIQNRNGVRGLQYLDGDTTSAVGFYPGNKLTDGRAILFYPQRRDVGVMSIVTPGSYVLPGAVTPQAIVKNVGSFTVPFYVQLRVNKANNDSVVWRDSLPVSSLNISSETLLTFQPWVATTGSYILKCSTAMAGDTVVGNDSKTLTFNVQSWLQEASIPTGIFNKRVKAGAAASADSIVYVLKGSNTNEFWRYRTGSDTWDSLPSMPLGPTGKKKTKDGCALAASPDSFVYAVKGGNTREFYRYNTLRQTWKTMDSVPIYPYGLRHGTSMACTDSEVYVLVGDNTTALMRFDIKKDTWRYDVPIEGGLGKKVKAGASLDYDRSGSLYAFKGATSSDIDEFWQYNISGQSWITRESIPLGPNRKKVKAGANSAYLNSHVYLLKGGNMNEFWAYNVATKTWGQKSDIPLGPHNYKMKPGSAMAASGQAVFVLKGGNRTEFWSYYPGLDTMLSVGPRKKSSVQAGSNAPIAAFEIRGGPNPFVAAALIRLAVPRLTRATLKVYDVSGKLVMTLLDGILPAGRRDIIWDARDRTGHAVPGGVYLLKFESPDYHATQKLILQR